jgi:hypothetical protein
VGKSPTHRQKAVKTQINSIIQPLNDNNMNTTTIAVLNSRKLATFCRENNLNRKSPEKFVYIIIAQDGTHLGTIDCQPSNNGKYLVAVREDGDNVYCTTFDEAIAKIRA